MAQEITRTHFQRPTKLAGFGKATRTDARPQCELNIESARVRPLPLGPDSGIEVQVFDHAEGENQVLWVDDLEFGRIAE